jgi:pimeloyl-ACP methyl ester carboxylesterase
VTHATQVIAPVPTLKWRPCGTGHEPLLCATADVPTDYDHPSGPKTRLALTKLPASGPPERRLGTLFTNPGGPGGSGVDFVQQDAALIYAPQVLARYDVLGFDPRGVARSDPATCFRTQQQELTSPLLPLLQTVYPLPGPQETRYTLDMLRLAVRCQTTSPRRLSSASTANVARDMDLLRQAVGDKRLTYAGYSYGTYLGATYAQLFPARVKRFVLDAPADPIAYSGTGSGDAAPTTPLGIRLRQGIGGSETFSEFARLCRDSGPQHCSLAAAGDPAIIVPATFDRLAREPVEITLSDGTPYVITQQAAVAFTYSTLFSPAAWPELADFLAALAAPTPSPIRVGATIAATRSPLGARPRGEDYPSIGNQLASTCVDTTRSRRVRQYPALIDAADAQAPYFGRYIGWSGLPCEFWTLQDDDAFHGPWQQHTQAPVLVIGTRFDPASPYRQAQPYADLFPHSRLLTLNGWGHTAIGKSTCVDTAITDYLIAGDTPPNGTACAPDTVPFTTQASATAAPCPGARSRLPAVVRRSGMRSSRSYCSARRARSRRERPSRRGRRQRRQCPGLSPRCVAPTGAWRSSPAIGRRARARRGRRAHSRGSGRRARRRGRRRRRRRGRRSRRSGGSAARPDRRRRPRRGRRASRRQRAPRHPLHGGRVRPCADVEDRPGHVPELPFLGHEPCQRAQAPSSLRHVERQLGVSGLATRFGSERQVLSVGEEPLRVQALKDAAPVTDE